MIYVLVILSGVSGGFITHTQEFYTKEHCEVVRDAIREHYRFFVTVNCYPK